MIRLGNKIRLTPSEQRRLSILTGGVLQTNSVKALNTRLEAAKAQYPGETAEEKLLRHIIERSKA